MFPHEKRECLLKAQYSFFDEDISWSYRCDTSITPSGGVVLHLPKWDNRVNMNLTTSVCSFFSLLLLFFSKLSYDFYICIFVVILNAYTNYSNYVTKWITFFSFLFFILFTIITTFKSILVRFREWKSNHNYPWVVVGC